MVLLGRPSSHLSDEILESVVDGGQLADHQSKVDVPVETLVLPLKLHVINDLVIVIFCRHQGVVNPSERIRLGARFYVILKEKNEIYVYFIKKKLFPKSTGKIKTI